MLFTCERVPKPYTLVTTGPTVIFETCHDPNTHSDPYTYYGTAEPTFVTAVQPELAARTRAHCR